MILVVGVTSLLGSRVVQGLLEKGHKVRVLISRQSSLESLANLGLVTTIQSLIDAGAKPVWGDPKSEASLKAALSGVDTVITTVSAAKHWGADSIESVDWQSVLNLIDSSRNAGVRRFLLASISGLALDNPDHLSQIMGEYEQLLQSSGMTYTIIQPTVFMEYWIGMMVGIPLMTQQAVTLIGRGDHAHNFVSEQDVADYFVAMIDHPQAYNQTVMVGGPASYTWTDVVVRIRNRMGAELPIQYAMMGTPISYLPEKAYPFVTEFERFENHLDITEISKTFGVRPTTLDDYIDRAFGRQTAAIYSTF